MPDLALAGERLIASVENARAPFTVDYTCITANTPASPVSAETVWVTTPAILFRAGRAYRMTVKGLITVSATGSEGRIRVRRANVSGTTLFDSFRISTPNAANYCFELSNIFLNSGASDISAALVGTVARDSGAANYHVSATPAANPAYILTEDIGPMADFPGATAL
ncbi:hypothetical protein ACIRD8_34965 [Streptomyces sp. NPDC102451]|uniref:hypothetical protein n=1 Tax=Streptomyces sp. NPDC102451 TaxID=3366177 RepID=UPI003805DBDB